jgi:hypothetical protein
MPLISRRSSLADDTSVPGTTVLLDDETAADDINLVPVPSASPADPLNWSKGRKYLSLTCMIFWVFAASFANGSLYPLYAPLQERANLSLNQLNTGVGYLFFFQQIFALVLCPLLIAVGKRQVFIATALGLCIFPFALSQVRSNAQWIGLIIVNCIFTSLVFVGPEIVLSDVVSPPKEALTSSSTTSARSRSVSTWAACGAARSSPPSHRDTSTSVSG